VGTTLNRRTGPCRGKPTSQSKWGICGIRRFSSRVSDKDQAIEPDRGVGWFAV